MQLKSSPKTYQGYKCDTPANTVQRVQEGFKRLGLDLKYLPTVKDPRTGMPRSQLKIYSGRAWIAGTPLNAGGKGLSHLLSKASAHAEVAERYSVGWMTKHYETLYKDLKRAGKKSPFDEDLLRAVANFSYLEGYTHGHQDEVKDAVRLEEFLGESGLSEDQMVAMAKLEMAQHWVDAYSVTEDRTVKVPMVFVRRRSSANSCAAGNTLEEAIAQGANEAFERYVSQAIMRDRSVLPTIDPASIKNEQIHTLIELFNSINVDVSIKDCSLGRGYPVMAVFFRNNNLKDDSNAPKTDIHYRKIQPGAHVSREQAILRGFVEAMQDTNLLIYRRGVDMDPFWALWHDELGKPYSRPQLVHPYLFTNEGLFDDFEYLDGTGEVVSLDRLPSHETDDCLKDIEVLADLCRSENRRLLVVNQTHPILGFPSVTVIIPGLSSVVPLAEQFYMGPPDEVSAEFPDRVKYPKVSHYMYSDDWLGDEARMVQFIADAEEYLSHYIVFSPVLVNSVSVTRTVNLFRVMAFAAIYLRDYRRAAEYLDLSVAVSDDVQDGVAFSEIRDQLKELILATPPDEDAIRAKLESIPPHHRHFVTRPLVNPFQHFCEGPCDNQCEAKSQAYMNGFLETFVNREPQAS